jgi:hypothetical protein
MSAYDAHRHKEYRQMYETEIADLVPDTLIDTEIWHSVFKVQNEMRKVAWRIILQLRHCKDQYILFKLLSTICSGVNWVTSFGNSEFTPQLVEMVLIYLVRAPKSAYSLNASGDDLWVMLAKNY